MANLQGIRNGSVVHTEIFICIFCFVHSLIRYAANKDGEQER